MRGRVREQKGIDGSCFHDLLCVVFLPFCSLAQESQVNNNLFVFIENHPNNPAMLYFSRRNLGQAVRTWPENEHRQNYSMLL